MIEASVKGGLWLEYRADMGTGNNRVRTVRRSFFRWLHETNQLEQDSAAAVRARSRRSPVACGDRRA